MLLLAFPDPSRPKSFYLDRVRRHREADKLIRGTGWDGHRGCAVGCTLECYDHSLYPYLLGVPLALAELEDFIFENLPSGYMDWPERFLAAIPEGADLSGVFSAWCVRVLDRCLDRIGNDNESWKVECRETIVRIRDLHARHSEMDRDTWSAAESAARSARDSIERSPIWSAMMSVVWSATGAAADSASASLAADHVASSAVWSAAAIEESAVWSDEIQKQADDMLELLESAPVPSKSVG